MNEQEKAVVEKLKRAESRRAARLANDRSVYAYRVNGSTAVCDNLLLLPMDSESAHKDFYEVQFSRIPLEKVKQFANVRLVRIGHFNVGNLRFVPCPEVVLIDFDEFIARLETVKKEKDEND